MDFSSMGKLDADTEIEKGSISSFSEVKNATIRVSEDYLELLNVVAGQLGLSRQAFMSKLIENYATQAVADYYMGYTNSFIDTPLDKLFDKATSDPKLKTQLHAFLKDVNYKVVWGRAANRGIYLMPLEEVTKLRFKHLERARLLEFHGEENISFPTDLPPLPEDKE